MKHRILAHARGALKSLTVWFAAVLAAAPDGLALLQANFPTIAPFIPESMHSRAMQVIALAILVLRVKTNSSLAAKVKPE